MKVRGKKFISLFLIFSLVTINCASLRTTGGKKEKHGAKLLITKKDEQQIKGELITVKPNSLLLLDTEGKDVSVGIADIKVIRVVKKSKAGVGAGIGGAAGALGGIITTGIVDAAVWEDESVGFMTYFLFGVIGLGVGALVGAGIGASVGTDETIQIEGMTDFHEFREALDKLRKKARIRDYK